MKRRDILKVGSSALALSAMWGSTAKAAADTTFAWSSAGAQGLVGQAFWLNHPARGALSVQLAAVSVPELKQPRIDQFTLEFSSGEAAIAAGTYNFEHASVGQFALYIAPVAAGAGNARYRADFNLLA